MSNIVKIDIEDYICTFADQKSETHLCWIVVNNNVKSARVGGIYLEMVESALLLDGVFENWNYALFVSDKRWKAASQHVRHLLYSLATNDIKNL